MLHEIHILRALLSIYVQLFEELIQCFHLDVPWTPQTQQAKNRTLPISPLPCPGSPSLYTVSLSTQEPLPESWEWSLSFQDRHSFPSLLCMSYPLVPKNTCFLNGPLSSHRHGISATSQCLMSVFITIWLLLGGSWLPGHTWYYLHTLVSCLPAPPSSLFFHPSSLSTNFSLAHLSLHVLSCLSGMLYPHPVYLSNLSCPNSWPSPGIATAIHAFVTPLLPLAWVCHTCFFPVGVPPSVSAH